ncbi:MAG: methenyltetrahydromethanopterin cyclohydrolase [Planctomycetales bacterium]|nr:methenyltetrahydromethanopterin cyclohydrolase [Planctomycetales bacterium]
MTGDLNLRARAIVEEMLRQADAMRIKLHDNGQGVPVLDCGVEEVGSLEAGLGLTQVTMSGLGRVDLVPGNSALWPGPLVRVQTDQPVAACLASQYAGWKVSESAYFAMASGPMRAMAAREVLFSHIETHEHGDHSVGVLETAELPPAEVSRRIAFACDVDPRKLILLVARTSSIAGSLQIVARSIETAMHKLHELQFDVSRILSGFGTAPLPPIAKDDLQGIGRTNDAILYGGDVTLWVNGDDDSLSQIVSRIPSKASADFGRPFAEIFAHYEFDLDKIDPQLFCPAQITLVNIDSGRVFRAGGLEPEVLRKSFEG